MKRSCQYCGRLHEIGERCPAHVISNRPRKHTADKFRSTYKWAKKRAEINERDHYLCQWCLHEHIITYGLLEVHHIESLETRYDLRLVDENLITLCPGDHKKAEAGLISKDELRKIAQVNTTPPPITPAAE